MGRGQTEPGALKFPPSFFRSLGARLSQTTSERKDTLLLHFSNSSVIVSWRWTPFTFSTLFWICSFPPAFDSGLSFCPFPVSSALFFSFLDDLLIYSVICRLICGIFWWNFRFRLICVCFESWFLISDAGNWLGFWYFIRLVWRNELLRHFLFWKSTRRNFYIAWFCGGNDVIWGGMVYPDLICGLCVSVAECLFLHFACSSAARLDADLCLIQKIFLTRSSGLLDLLKKLFWKCYECVITKLSSVFKIDKYVIVSCVDWKVCLL